MRILISYCLILSLAVGLHSGWGIARGAEIPRDHHPWGRFDPGTWSLVREVTQTFDEEGAVTLTSIADKRTTLLEVGKDGVRLKRDVVHDVAGKQYDGEPETLKEGFHGELVLQGLKIKEAASEHVVIEGRKIACYVLQLEFSGPASKTVTKIYYCSKVAPYVLKRESVTSDLEGKNVQSETTIDVVALDMPYRVLAEIQDAAYVKTVIRQPKGTTTTFAVTSSHVPGGVIWRGSKELDQAGRLIRRSLLELVDYGLEPEPERTGVFPFRRRGIFFRQTFPVRKP